MTFEVVWQPLALTHLAELWLHSDSEIRSLINEATNRIDLLLSENPLVHGESRPRGRRIMFVPPLGVIFRIDRAKNTAYVLSIWPIRPRKS